MGKEKKKLRLAGRKEAELTTMVGEKQSVGLELEAGRDKGRAERAQLMLLGRKHLLSN